MTFSVFKLSMSSDPNPPHHSLSSSIDIGAIRRFPSTLTIPTVGNSERPTVQDIFTPFPHESSEHREPARGENFRHATIEMLPEDTLLEIFDFYRLNAMERSSKFEVPWKWQRLAHVCRKWRQVLTMSPRRLGLQIYCKTGRPIKPTLDSWPTLPLVVRVDHRKSKSLHKNIILALRHSDRVCDIRLIFPVSTIASIIDALQEPFPKLERIRIWPQGFERPAGEPPVLTKFLGGSTPSAR